jgi:hypothetical protein
MTPIGPGSLLAGRFRLEDLLEETGGARFWRATDLTLMRDVAVHVVDEGDPRAAALLTAARTSAAVSVPHLLRVLDAAREDGVVYVVNEWGNGLSLDRMLLEGPLPPRQAAWMVREVADAITDAHRYGVAHGRLIPENVMVTESGAVKLIGFVVDGVLHGRSGTSMSEHESDVRNLAALLYAALVGRWPGTPGSTVPAAPHRHGRVMSPRQVRAGVPKPLDRICDTVLNPSDEHDFPIETAYEIKAALADFLGEDQEVLPPLAGDAEATQRFDLPAEDDPEATQAAAPAFAEDDTARWRPEPEPTAVHPVQSSTKSPYVGMGGGRLPPAWGPDAPGEPEPAPPQDWVGDAPGSSWLRLAGLVAGLAALAVAVVFAFNLGRGNDGEEPTGQATPGASGSRPAAVQLAAVKDFDPFQDGGPKEENPELVPLAHDGDPRTAWETSTYLDGPDITVYKPGVGLLLDLGEEREVADVRTALLGGPYDVRLLAAPPGTAEPTGVEGLDEAAATTGAEGTVTLAPEEGLTTRYLVLWLTALPPADGGYKGQVAEVVVRS